MQTITVNLNLSRGFFRISQPLYLGETVSLSFSEAGAYSLILTEPFADCPNDGVTVWAQSTDDCVLALNRKALHSAFKKADAMQPNMTVTAKGFVISEDGQTVADGEVTIEYSPKAFIIDENEYPLAREVLAQAEAAKNSAVSAKSAAEEAKSKAEGAQSAAEKARDEARSARNEAQEAKTGAEKALSAAKESAATSSAAKEDAITAQNASEAARNAAQNAQEAAETARDEAETVAKETATGLVEASEKRLQEQIDEKTDKESFNTLAIKVNTVIAGDTGKSARTIAAEEVAKVVENAPANLDTLKEIADYIESDKTGAAQMVTQIDANAKAISAEVKRAQEAEAALGEEIAKKVDAVEGKGLSTNDYTTEEKEKLEGVEAGAQKNPDLSDYAKKDEVNKELAKKQDKLIEGDNITIAEDGTISAKVDMMVETSWADLITLRNNGELIAGMQYRITDYVATTKQEHTESANNPFDIIVTADSEYKLNEVARAIRHNGDTYFPEFTKFEAWKIWYSIDNDSNRFYYAAPNGKGVIYRMIDEFGNDIPYDFKGIKMQVCQGFDEFYGSLVFTDYFSYTFGDSSSDDSIVGGSRFNVMESGNNGTVDFINGNTFNFGCCNNHIGKSCTNNSFGYGCHYNILDSDCVGNVFNLNCMGNHIGHTCYYNYFNSDCMYNTLGCNCYNNRFEPYSRFNTLDSECVGNILGEYCSENYLGKSCFYNTFGMSCAYNTLGALCGSNNFYEYCYENTLGAGCDLNNFTSGCGNNIIGSDCSENTANIRSTIIGSGCVGNYIEEMNMCEIKSGIKYQYFESNADYIDNSTLTVIESEKMVVVKVQTEY